MNLSASPSSGLGYCQPSAYQHSNFNQGNMGGFRTSNLTAKGAIATYDRIISSSKSNRSQAMNSAYQVQGQYMMGPIHEEVKIEDDEQDESMMPNGGRAGKQQIKVMKGQDQAVNKISSGGGSLCRKSHNFKQQDEWMPPKKHNPFEMPLQTVKEESYHQSQAIKQVEKKLLEKHSQLLQQQIPEAQINMQPSPLTAQQLNFYNVANFPSMILDHTHDQSTTQLLSIHPQDVSALNQSLQNEQNLLFSRAKQQQALHQLIIDHQKFQQHQQLQAAAQQIQPVYNMESNQTEINASQPSNLEDLMCSQEDIDEIKKRLDFNRQTVQRLPNQQYPQNQGPSTGNYQSNTSFVFQTQNSLLSINDSMRLGSSTINQNLDDANPFQQAQTKQINDSRDRYFDQAAPIPFEEIMFQQQQRNLKQPQFFERQGQPILSHRERQVHSSQIVADNIPSARSQKQQQNMNHNQILQMQNQQPNKGVPFNYQQNTQLNYLMRNQNNQGGHQVSTLHPIGLVQKNCINIFQGEQSHHSSSVHTNQDLGQQILRLHPQSLINSCGSGYSSCTRYDACTMDEAHPNLPSMHPFLSQQPTKGLQLNLKSLSSQQQAKPSHLSTARTNDSIPQEGPTQHYKPLSSRMPHKQLNRQQEKPSISNRDSNSESQPKKNVVEKRQESVESSKRSGSKKAKKGQEQLRNMIVVSQQKRVQSANVRSREGSQSRERRRPKSPPTKESEPQGLYKTMVIQKDKIIPAATHRGVVEVVNPLKIAKKNIKEINQVQSHGERLSIGDDIKFNQNLRINKANLFPMNVFQASPGTVENTGQQYMISGAQSNTSGQNSFLNGGSHGILQTSDQKLNPQITSTSTTSHVHTTNKKVGLPPQGAISSSKKQKGIPTGHNRQSQDPSRPHLGGLFKSQAKQRAAPLPPQTTSGKKGSGVSVKLSSGKDSSVTRQKAVEVGGNTTGAAGIRSNSSRNVISREYGAKTDVIKESAQMPLPSEVIIKSARSVSKRPLTAGINGVSESSMKQNKGVIGIRKDSVRSLKNQSSLKNLQNKNGISQNKENIKPFDIGAPPILSHREKSNSRNKVQVFDENKVQQYGVSQSYEIFQKIAQQMAILQNSKPSAQVQGINQQNRFSDEDNHYVPKFVADMMLKKNENIQAPGSRNPLSKIISQNQLKSSDNYVLAQKLKQNHHEIEGYTVQTSVDFMRNHQKQGKRMGENLSKLAQNNNISSSHEASTLYAHHLMQQLPHNLSNFMPMQLHNHQQQQPILSPYTSNQTAKGGKNQMIMQSATASSLVSSKASSSQKYMHSAGQGQGGYKQSEERSSSAAALKNMELMDKLRAARNIVRH